MVAIVSGALLTGLLSTGHCVLMCGPLAALAAGRPGGTLAWSAGRVLSYASLGAAAGGLASALGQHVVSTGVIAAVLVAVSAGSLAGLWHLPGLVPTAVLKRVHTFGRGQWFGNVVLGAVSGLLPCGVVWSGLALAAAAGGGWIGAAAMAALALGTVPAFAIAGAGLHRALHSSARARVAAAVVVLLTGWGAVAFRVNGAMHSADGAPACHAAQ